MHTFLLESYTGHWLSFVLFLIFHSCASVSYHITCLQVAFSWMKQAENSSSHFPDNTSFKLLAHQQTTNDEFAIDGSRVN